MDLKAYIKKYYKDSQVSFAEAQDVMPQQVTKWLAGDFIVKEHVLYSPRRDLEKKLKRGE